VVYDKDRWRASVSNGKIPASLLAQIEPRQHDPDLNGPAMMHPEAARAMSALLAAAPDELAVKYSYRTFAKQVEKWNDYKNGTGNLAAVPGTSNHGWAVAVDFTGLSTAALAWLKAHAKEYGYLNDVPSENWHYTYQGGYKPPKPGYKFKGKVYRSRYLATRALRRDLKGAKTGAERTVRVVERDR
jgi:hypothetical protein